MNLSIFYLLLRIYKINNFLNNSVESSSAPQVPVGGQFGQISNNGTNLGGNGGSLPGGGYPGEYYSHHNNESMPTSPSVNSGSMDLENSNLPQTCDCSQVTNVQEMVPTDASSAGDAAPSGAGDAGSSGSTK